MIDNNMRHAWENILNFYDTFIYYFMQEKIHLQFQT